MRGLFRLLSFLFVLALFVVPIGAVVLSLQSHALVAENPPYLFASVKEARDFVKRFDPREMDPNSTTSVTATQAELNSALAGGLGKFPKVKAEFDIGGGTAELMATLELPIPNAPFGRFVNVRVDVPASQNGLKFSRVVIGKLPIAPFLAKQGLIWAMDVLLGGGKGKPVFDSVKSVSVAGDSVTVAFQPPANIVVDLTAAARRNAHTGDSDKIRVYYQKLVDVGRAAGSGQVSLAAFIGPAFTLAETRSADHDPIEENRSLLLALGLYFGDSRLERLMADVKTGALAGPAPNADNVKVANRHDWVQHMLTSAALQLAGGTAITNVIGESKEVLDTEGAEGFSFGDIAADRTGVHLAEVSTRSDASARKVQRALSGHPRESSFFPATAGLPEDMSEADFKRIYGDRDSAKYKAQIADIERRITAVPLYN
jgi:hypothetical protein